MYSSWHLYENLSSALAVCNLQRTTVKIFAIRHKTKMSDEKSTKMDRNFNKFISSIVQLHHTHMHTYVFNFWNVAISVEQKKNDNISEDLSEYSTLSYFKNCLTHTTTTLTLYTTYGVMIFNIKALVLMHWWNLVGSRTQYDSFVP